MRDAVSGYPSWSVRLPTFSMLGRLPASFTASLDLVGMGGFEPPTTALSERHSTSELHPKKIGSGSEIRTHDLCVMSATGTAPPLYRIRIWQGRQATIPQPLVLETSALPT